MISVRYFTLREENLSLFVGLEFYPTTQPKILLLGKDNKKKKSRITCIDLSLQDLLDFAAHKANLDSGIRVRKEMISFTRAKVIFTKENVEIEACSETLDNFKKIYPLVKNYYDHLMSQIPIVEDSIKKIFKNVNDAAQLTEERILPFAENDYEIEMSYSINFLKDRFNLKKIQ